MLNSLIEGPFTWVTYVVAVGIGAAIMLGWAAFMSVIWTYGERRIAGFIQGRVGPNRVGPMGILQPIADGIKLLVKEDIIPQVAWKFLYTAAPVVVFVGAFLPFAALPFSEHLVVINMEVGLYYILAFEALEVIGILMAGWAPGSKWSLYGGMRLAAQMLSYEVPMGLCVLTVVVLAGSLNLADIVAWQSGHFFGWAVFRSPATALAFVMFYVGGLAATKRAPFDLPEAESELVAGYHTEYSGMRFAFFFMAEYASMYLVCALSVILFLGGWYGPIPRPSLPEGVTLLMRWDAMTASAQDLWGLIRGTFALLGDGQALRIMAHESVGAVNLVGKSFVLYFLMIWARWTLPRIRIDQVMYICLKVLLPFSLACVVLAMVQAVVF